MPLACSANSSGSALMASCRRRYHWVASATMRVVTSRDGAEVGTSTSQSVSEVWWL